MDKISDFLYELGSDGRIIASLFSLNPSLDALVGSRDKGNEGMHWTAEYNPQLVSNLATYLLFDSGYDETKMPITGRECERILGKLSEIGLHVPEYYGRSTGQLNMLLGATADYVISRAHLASVARKSKAA